VELDFIKNALLPSVTLFESLKGMSWSAKKQILINLLKTRQVRDAIRAKVEEFIRKSAGGKLAALDFSLKAAAEILRVLNIPGLVPACPVGLATQAHVSRAAVAEGPVIKEAAAAESAEAESLWTSEDAFRYLGLIP
jgi:hypothetical protein